MADNVTLPGSGTVVATDEATDATLGTVHFQYMKLADGTLGSTNKASIDSGGRLNVGLGERFISATSVAGTTNSSVIDVTGFEMVRVELDTNAGTVPYFEVSPNGSTGWRAAAQSTGPAGNGTSASFVASSSGQVRYLDVRGYTGVRLNNSSGANSCTFNATLVPLIGQSQDIYIHTLSLSGTTPAANMTPIRLPFAASSCRMTLSFGTMTVFNQVTMYGTTDVNNTNATMTCAAFGDYAYANQSATTAGATYYPSSLAQVFHMRGATYAFLGTLATSTGTCTVTLTFYRDKTVQELCAVPLPTVLATGNNLTGTLNMLGVKSSAGEGGTYDGYPVVSGGIVKSGAAMKLTDGQVHHMRLDKTGRQIVKVGQSRELHYTTTVTLTATTAETTLIGAQGAGIFADITSMSLFNSSATSAVITLRYNTAGTVIARYVVPAGGGVVLNHPVALNSNGAANLPWTVQSDAAVSSIYINCTYSYE